MLNVFTLANGRLFQEEIESLEDLARFTPVWVDMEAPTPEERRWVRQHFGLSIPEDAMDDDIEESARFFQEDNGELHVRSDFLIADDDNPRAVRVATRTARGLSSSAIRKSLRTCSSPLSSWKKRADSSMSSSIASSGMDKPKCWRTQRRSSGVGASISTHTGVKRARSSRDSISS